MHPAPAATCRRRRCAGGLQSCLWICLTQATGAEGVEAAAHPGSIARLLQDSCQDAARWSQHPWGFLSQVERDAWSTLGWTQQSWDLAHPVTRRRLQVASSTNTTTTTTTTTYRPPSDSACFGDLTEDRRDAVLMLGYTIQTWHACKNPSCPWPQGIPLPSAPCLDHLIYLENRYSNLSWDQTPIMSVLKRDAFRRLGWDRARWNAQDKPPTYAQPWTELTVREQEAAQFLGYSEQVWHGCETQTPCLVRLKRLQAKLDVWNWGTMPGPVRSRLQELGWTSRAWTEGEEPPALRLQWLDQRLTYGQKIAAKILGYQQDTWEMCPYAACVDRFAWVKAKYATITWADMKLAVRRAWMMLGHTEKSWAAGHDSRAWGGWANVMMTRWDELSPEQQAQAAFLGHSRATWQGCNENWSGTTAAPNATLPPLSDTRTVRSRMTIQRPFNEISGNVYGAAVAQLPTSFIQNFEEAVGRALFCGNPPTSADPATYLNADGSPLCILQTTYDQQQRQARRVRVISVSEGSILVDFTIMANRTASEPSALSLFNLLKRQLANVQSPLCQDALFGRYAVVATVKEVHVQVMITQQMPSEQLRAAYSPNTACQLQADGRNPKVRCGTGSAQGPQGLRLILGLLPFSCLMALL